MRNPSAVRLIVVLAVGAIVAVATAQVTTTSAPYWPGTSGASPVKEWYSDIPWHQKLGTFAGNEIDEALVLPYEALGDAEKAFCTGKGLSPEDCMIEIGVNNVIGMLRTDTPYNPQDPKIKAAKECQDPALPCIQVTLELSSFWTRGAGAGVALVPRPLGIEPQKPPYNAFYGGYVITDGSTYAPQMPWYTSHYCDSAFPSGVNDVQDPVCYGDYFSPMNNGFNPLPAKRFDEWPKSGPWSVYPMGEGGSPPPPINHCKGGPDVTKCTMAMAGFDLTVLSPNMAGLQYQKYNQNLLDWFNAALQAFPADAGPAEQKHKFPWSGKTVTWEGFIYPRAELNPFLGQFANVETAPAVPADCDVTAQGPTNPKCTQTATRRGSSYLYPRQCSLADLYGANSGNTASVARLRQCGLNYELHHNGYLEQWPGSFWGDLDKSGMLANQYGRTSFLFAGVPGMQQPVSFYKDPDSDSGLTVYERSHNASIFSLYLPIANVADSKRAFTGRNYTDKEFYHTLLMSNHMESDPWSFADGIRGKVLWHNEYRTQKMYDSRSATFSPDRMFAAAFKAETAASPFHNNTCDGCHVRNGSGVPINTEGKLDPALREFMKGDVYNPYVPVKDYTFTGVIRPMKLVFFDLQRDTSRLDGSRYSEPLSFLSNVLLSPPRTLQGDLYYNNKIMNFYGDSFHATTPGYNFAWSYEPASASRLVVTTRRHNAELNKDYEPKQIRLGAFQTSTTCQLVTPPPTTKPWPASCSDIGDAAIQAAIKDSAVGYMLLNGKRLGNLAAMEAMSNQAIMGFRDSQKALLGDKMAGELIWTAGSRDGVGGKVFKECRTKSATDCFIGRFGWLGDRASLEDQVANAAFVEMNMTTSAGYKQLYGNTKAPFPIRYAGPNCGPANKTCVESKGNSDLSERDVERMADYARWVGNPTRSELKVSLPEVIAGEKIFRQVKCDTCHVIRKIAIDPEDTMLTRNYRDRLTTHVVKPAVPFLSYIGTDLLMHDMGYLSQVGHTTQAIRDADGVVLPAFANFVQKVRTPALKGLRFNRYVTEAHKNTNTEKDPACDFLLHDGRACDAIEAAFLHDGPAIRKLGVIDGLNALSAQQVLELRAFLYSL